MLTFNEESNPRHQSTGRHQRCAPEPDEPDVAASTVAAAALGVPAAALSPAEVEKRCARGGGSEGHTPGGAPTAHSAQNDARFRTEVRPHKTAAKLPAGVGWGGVGGT